VVLNEGGDDADDGVVDDADDGVVAEKAAWGVLARRVLTLME
jgi:hypothetical protein